MDVPLYALALVTFGVLYLVLNVFLVFVLLLSLLVMYLYIVLRYGKLPENYPYSGGDTLITTIFIGVTWGIFTLLGPKYPVPFVGAGFTYTTAPVSVGGILTITIVLLLLFIVIGAVVMPRLRDRGRSGGGTRGPGGTDSQGQQSVGAG